MQDFTQQPLWCDPRKILSDTCTAVCLCVWESRQVFVPSRRSITFIRTALSVCLNLFSLKKCCAELCMALQWSLKDFEVWLAECRLCWQSWCTEPHLCKYSSEESVITTAKSHILRNCINQCYLVQVQWVWSEGVWDRQMGTWSQSGSLFSPQETPHIRLSGHRLKVTPQISRPCQLEAPQRRPRGAALPRASSLHKHHKTSLCGANVYGTWPVSRGRRYQQQQTESSPVTSQQNTGFEIKIRILICEVR